MTKTTALSRITPSRVATMALSTLLLSGTAAGLDLDIQVASTPTCGCCGAWIEHLEDEGFNVTAYQVDHAQLNDIKAGLGITPGLASCHTAMIGDYFIEGHVHANEIRALVGEGPDARGLTVPGMPIGSPGMEMGDQRDAYETLLVTHDGETVVFETHNQ